jgi:hypothetical protein
MPYPRMLDIWVSTFWMDPIFLFGLCVSNLLNLFKTEIGSLMGGENAAIYR